MKLFIIPTLMTIVVLGGILMQRNWLVTTEPVETIKTQENSLVENLPSQTPAPSASPTQSPSVVPYKILTPIESNSIPLYSLNENMIFELFNKRRIENGVNPLRGNDDEICRIANDDLILAMKLGRLATIEEHKQVTGPKTFRNVSSLVGIGLTSEVQAIESFYNSDRRYFFTAGEYVWGCVQAESFYAVLTVAY